jgi:hypothetical protein
MRQFLINLKYGSTIYTSIKHMCLQIRTYNSVFFVLGLKALCTQPGICGIKCATGGKELTVSNLEEHIGYPD